MVVGLFMSWRLPTQEQQKSCILGSGSFNYDPSFYCTSSNPNPNPKIQEEIEQTLTKHGFFINRSRSLLGSGPSTFHLAKSALISWRHFGLGWAFVDPKTPIKRGTKFCVCVKEFIPWIMMPLQIAYVTDTKDGNCERGGHIKASFEFGSGTLHGHLLSGEERFSVELDEKNNVWYEIYSFSKPANLLSVIGYPYVRHRQKLFAQKSAHALLKHIEVTLPPKDQENP